MAHYFWAAIDVDTWEILGVWITPNMIVASERYLRTRIQTKDPEYNDHLIIIDRGSHYGKLFSEKRGDYIWRRTKKIAIRAGFKRSVYPYLIKPSALTDGFNKQVNPHILQRQARHKNIEATLWHDHTSDKMAKDYFNRVQSENLENLSQEDKAKAEDTHGLVGPEGTLEVTMPRNKIAINSLFLRFLERLEGLLERFPNLFSILRLLLQRLGLQ